MHDALGHRRGAAAHIDHHQQFARGIHGRPYPVWRALQASDGLVLTEVAVLDCTQDGVQCIELQLLQVKITQKIRGKGAQLLGRFDQSAQHGVRINLKDARHGTNAEAFGQSRESPHQLVGIDLLAVKRGAVRLEEIPVAA